jgi:hypothetical protein
MTRNLFEQKFGEQVGLYGNEGDGGAPAAGVRSVVVPRVVTEEEDGGDGATAGGTTPAALPGATVTQGASTAPPASPVVASASTYTPPAAYTLATMEGKKNIQDTVDVLDAQAKATGIEVPKTYTKAELQSANEAERAAAAQTRSQYQAFPEAETGLHQFVDTNGDGKMDAQVLSAEASEVFTMNPSGTKYVYTGGTDPTKKAAATAYAQGVFDENTNDIGMSEYAKKALWDEKIGSKEGDPGKQLNAVSGMNKVDPKYTDVGAAIGSGKVVGTGTEKERLIAQLKSKGISDEEAMDLIWSQPGTPKASDLLSQIGAGSETSDPKDYLTGDKSQDAQGNSLWTNGSDGAAAYERRKAEFTNPEGTGKVDLARQELETQTAKEETATLLKRIAQADQSLTTLDSTIPTDPNPDQSGYIAASGKSGREYIEAINLEDTADPKDKAAAAKKRDAARSAYIQDQKDALIATKESAQRELDRSAYGAAKRTYDDQQQAYDKWNSQVIEASEAKDAVRYSNLVSTKDDKTKVELTQAGKAARSEATKNAWGRAGTTLSNPSEVPKGINTTATEVVDMGKTLLKAPGEAVTAWRSLDKALSESDEDVKATLGKSAAALKAAADKKGRFDDEIGKSRFKDGTTDTIGAKDKKGSGLLAEMLKAHQAKGAEFDDLANQSTEQGGATLKARGEGAAQEALASKTDEEAEKLDIKNDRKAGKFV